MVAAVAAAVAGSEGAPAENAALLQASAAAASAIAPSALPSVKDAVPVVVEAQDEAGAVFKGEYLLDPSAPIRPLLDAWAHDNQVPTSCVTFEDAEGRILDLGRAPAELGWLHAASPIRVFARPAEEEAGDGGSSEAQLPPGGQSSPPTSANLAAPLFSAAPWNSAAAPWNRGVDPDDEEVDLFGDADDGEGDLCALDRSIEDSPDGAEIFAPSSAPPEPPEQPPKRRRTEADAAPEPPARPRATAVKAGAQRKPAARVSAAGEQVQEEPSTPSRMAKSAGCLSEDEIAFQELNPKPEGSQARDRYNAYKAARTVREALALGASKDDLAYDRKRGFLRRRPP